MRSDCPDDYAGIQGNEPSTVLILGGSGIIDPLRWALEPPVFDTELIQYSEFDRRLIANGEYGLDIVGHYARPDVFGLSVNTGAQKAVSLRDGPEAKCGLLKSWRAEDSVRP